MDEKDIQILKNTRVAENDFSMKYPCDFCDNFVNQVVVLVPPCINTVCQSAGVNICKRCLSQMIEILDKNMQGNFQLDFERSRNGQNATGVN